jgi:pyruvate formate lyase activating enzyme
MINRRLFLKTICLTPLALKKLEAKDLPQPGGFAKEARFYRKLSEPKNGVSCSLCPRECMIPDGELGFCRARKNAKGTLYALGYASPCAVHIDPIEKKPFYHVRPTSSSFSIASAGCNLRCRFCQNWQISQVSPLDTTNEHLPPQAVVEAALKSRCESIAHTYTEPTNFYEYMLDVAMLARKKGVITAYHSNGFINQEPLKQLCNYLDAADIDLKGFSQAFYSKLCEADLKPVLETLKTLKERGVWLEITNLIIPGQNDDPAMITEMCTWIKTNLGPDVPVHFSRFFPMYKMTNIAPTPVPTIERARDIALKTGLHYAYTGNVPGSPGESTYCPGCKNLIIKRVGYSVLSNEVKNGKCRYCGAGIKGLWSA